MRSSSRMKIYTSYCNSGLGFGYTTSNSAKRTLPPHYSECFSSKTQLFNAREDLSGHTIPGSLLTQSQHDVLCFLGMPGICWEQLHSICINIPNILLIYLKRSIYILPQVQHACITTGQNVGTYLQPDSRKLFSLCLTMSTDSCPSFGDASVISISQA